MKKLILPLIAGLLVLSAGAPRASLIFTINVTTTDDEDGTNSAACSLREAVKAVNSLKAYGGCPAGDAFADNVIQLEAEEYSLTKGELYVTNGLTLKGKDAQKEAHDLVEDPLTHVKPREFRPDYEDADPAIGETGTFIVATPGSRILNNIDGVSLVQLVLVGSASSRQVAPQPVADNGGIIFATAAVTMRNVVVSGGSVTGTTLASGNGGAIYLGGDNTALTLIDVTIQDNHADNKGGAVALLCSSGVNPFAQHAVTVSRSLIRGNSSGEGAGAFELCGNTNVTLTASTLSANSSASGSGTLAYVQGAEVEQGQLNLNYVTAVEQDGHVLALNGLASVNITGSLLSGFDTGSATEICHNPNSTVEWASATPGDSFNAFDNDGSCAGLLSTSGTNVPIVVNTPLLSVLVPIQHPRGPGGYYPAASTAGAPFGLTDYYLPKLAVGSPILDRGPAIGNCLGGDQRNTDRRSGAACDIGAVERLQISSRDDAAESKADTDRLAIVDVLANDSYGEDDSTGPYKFAANTPDDPDTGANELAPSVILVDDAGGRCEWRLSNDPDYPGKLVVQSLDTDWLAVVPSVKVPNGALTPEATPITCTYRVVDNKPETSATVGTVKVQIKNQAPNALADSYLRPVGTAEVVFDPLENDNDEGDGKFGLVAHATPNADPDLPDIVTYGPEVDWAPFYPVEIVSAPSLGKVYGASSGLCPGSTTIPKICLTPPLRYVADNNLSPFTDSFSYTVYDSDGQSSGAAVVSVYTDAPDPDHGGGAGSFDWLPGIALGLLGLRRFRRL